MTFTQPAGSINKAAVRDQVRTLKDKVSSSSVQTKVGNQAPYDLANNYLSTNNNVFRNNGIHASIDHDAIKKQKIALSKSNFKMGLANVNYTSTSSLYHSPKDSSQTYGKDYRTSRLQANI